MDIAIEATPDAQLDIYLDKASGHMVQGRGSGKMLMHLTPRGTSHTGRKLRTIERKLHVRLPRTDKNARSHWFPEGK